MDKTILVGDIHGCVDELRDLLRAAGYRLGDPLVAVGDLVAKGPDSQGVLQLLRESKARAVLGNHDAHALRARRQSAAGDRDIKAERQQVLDTLTAADW